ncbi:hypothetical protein MKW94_023699 [Papaver nudicaule]|uniref:Uncharacterized protein n=1 Tax=Papaver nudicaule TaxID=74823 RepID=A0AA42AWA1_PAPNU|nr:hypothetical protein [Papaver nudicaule]
MSCLTSSKDQFSDTSDEEVAMNCIVADSLQFGKHDDICPEKVCHFKDATGTGMGEGAGVDDANHQTNKEAHSIGTSDKPDEGLDASNDLSSKDYKGVEGLSERYKFEGLSDERYEYLIRISKRHDGCYIPFAVKNYGNFHDISKHPRYRFFK